MTVGLDTSVVVRLLTGEPKELAFTALHYLDERRKNADSVLVSDWVLAETYYALQHHYGASKKEALGALRDFMSTSGVEGTGEASEILQISNLESAKPGFIDRVIHAGYLKSGAQQLVTFEKASQRLPAVLVLTAQAT